LTGATSLTESIARCNRKLCLLCKNSEENISGNRDILTVAREYTEPPKFLNPSESYPGERAIEECSFRKIAIDPDSLIRAFKVLRTLS
jgi:hypothetical protein